METEQLVLHMNGGVGESSYANNSSFQRKVMFTVKPILEESIKKLYWTIDSTDNLKVADLGCSSGPNALVIASNIINIIDAISISLNCGPPIFEFFLNDLNGNDFNSVFKLLPAFYKSLQEEKRQKFSCFFHGTPGNFYGRLFPNTSFHFFHSSYSLHWLSQAPKGLIYEGEQLNKGQIYITNTSPPAVYKAFLEQFQEDFHLFLRSRSEELVAGGCMVLTLIGRDKNSEIMPIFRLIGMALRDLVSENLIEEQKLDSFNIPYYSPTAEEVKQVIQEEGSFTLQTLDVIKMNWDDCLNEVVNGSIVDESLRAEFKAKYVRAFTESLLKAHFGEEIINELFQFKQKVIQFMKGERFEYPSLVLHLVKI